MRLGNSCDLLTVTAPSRTPKELNARVGVVFTARVHPGESNASWIMQVCPRGGGTGDAAMSLRRRATALSSRWRVLALPCP